MDAGLVVVLAVLVVFLMVPLAFAWVSTNPRPAARVERVLGREPRGSERWARWSIGLWFGVGAAWIIMGITQVVTGQSTETEFEWISFALGALYLLTAGTQYFTYRHMRRAGSAEAQVEGRAEPGRPGAGG